MTALPVPSLEEHGHIQSGRAAVAKLCSLFRCEHDEIEAVMERQRLEAEAIEAGDLSAVEPLISKRRAKFLRRRGRAEAAAIRTRLADAEAIMAEVAAARDALRPLFARLPSEL